MHTDFKFALTTSSLEERDARFERFLNESKISKSCFMEYCVKKVSGRPSFICGSAVEEGGNIASDVDVFILCDSLEKEFIEIDNFENLRIDIEYMSVERLKKVNEKMKRSRNLSEHIENISDKDLKNFHRLVESIPIAGKSFIDELKTDLDLEAFWMHACRHHMYAVESLYKDSLGALKSKQLEYSLLRLRQTLEMVVDTFLVINGDTSIRSKYRVLKLKGVSEQLYKDFQFFLSYWPLDERELELFVEKFLRYVKRTQLEFKKYVDALPYTYWDGEY